MANQDFAALLSLMTSNACEAQFQHIISTQNLGEIQRIASTMMLYPDIFTMIARHKNGTERVQKLLGKSPDADFYFYTAIYNNFFVIMCDTYSSKVVTQAARVFDQEKSRALCQFVYMNSLQIACTRSGCIVINDILTNVENNNTLFKNAVLALIVYNAVSLSYGVFGNFVVQQVLKMNDVLLTERISVRLHGYCVELSFNKQGSFIVERFLDGTVHTITRVVYEILACDGEILMSLARHPFGNFVVAKALRATQERYMELFLRLVEKLMPFRERLRSSYAYSILHFLDQA